ncbi:MAG: hypothetical protein PWR29_1337 [Methanolobus sp.]|jgi:hypothetical protein|nr:hypothetical protein [Methanolobus sp.]MDK2833378.1 hypothetical protein [Methanolobus sp.]MDK2912380.1 hypothetical protein [Methanolobus sp.]
MNEENKTIVEESEASDTPAVRGKNTNSGYTARTQNEEKKKTTPEEYFRWGVFGTTMLLLIIAAFQLYFSMQEVIRTWFEWQYVSLFKSAYNLVIIALCIYIIRLYIFRKQA